MIRHSQIQRSAIRWPSPEVIPSSGLVQRKCACEQSSGLTGRCEECQQKDLTLQRTASGGDSIYSAPSIVHKVIGAPGQPLDQGTRVFMDSRLGHDFRHVRVHTDAAAARSARAVSAQAYTVGLDVVFRAGKYMPRTAEGTALLAHELTHVVQQSGRISFQNDLEIANSDSPLEREADEAAANIFRYQPLTEKPSTIKQSASPRSGLVMRAAIHHGNILDEGSCEHLACNSKYACEDSENGIECPEGTRNASKDKTFRPLFTCDTKCENNLTCSDSGDWMAIPKSRFARRKCDENLVICANGKFTHGIVRDRSEREAWEVSHGIQDSLGVSPYAKFTGTIYGDKNDKDFKTDKNCHSATSSKPEKTTTAPSEESKGAAATSEKPTGTGTTSGTGPREERGEHGEE